MITKPEGHRDCTLSPHCRTGVCRWIVCKEHQVAVSNRPGLTEGTQIPWKILPNR